MCRGTRCRPIDPPVHLNGGNLALNDAHQHSTRTAATAPLTPSLSTTPQSSAKRRAFLTRSLATRTISFVDSEVERLTKEYTFLKKVQPSTSIAKLDRSELVLGERLGEGGFSQVYAVASICLDDNECKCDIRQLGVRSTLQKSANESYARYVLKHLRPDWSSSPQKQQRAAFHEAAADLVLEAQFLARMDHPNIIQLCGWAAGGTSCFGKGSHDAYFLLLDRLDETLSNRINTWRREHDAEIRSNGSDAIHRYEEKLDLASQLASALVYLHERRIVYRDLKADNVGLINGNQVQLFDFGLARELPPSSFEIFDTKKQAQELFRMSGVGTRRYCAPEVVLGHAYNLQADVYSMAIVVHEMMSHNKPFGVIGPESHRVLVADGGQRPAMPHSWPTSLQKLLRRGWAASLQDRPTMTIFRQELQKLKVKDEPKCEHKRSLKSGGRIFRRISKDRFPCSIGMLSKLIRKCEESDGCCSGVC
ncbi:serine/threonine protein kinase [Nitzschia inconspicua]|uniref:Serine/threonine protein kinase n=1 Tax=Nitzschia inconspicua TaxID=303405 RepID=A0A9K3KKD7_9STRA|nr:serine/threonine protein kinase [Nitzschia inconspicua]